jgi:hypothetical protein
VRIDQRDADLVVDARDYRLVIPAGRGVAWLHDRSGERWAELRLLASVDTLDGPDETLAVGDARVDERPDDVRLTWELASSRWDARRLVLEASDDRLVVRAEVEGAGRPTDVTLLAGRAVLPRSSGFPMSGRWFETLFSAAPADPGRIVTPASESASIGVASGSEPGRGSWFFTPAPFLYAAARPAVGDALAPPNGPWLTFGLEPEPGEANFNGFSWRAADRGFGLVLDYEGKTAVAGRWTTPRLVIAFADDPYEAIARQHTSLARGAPAPGAPAEPPATPAWWRQPMFCGWGAQGALARADGRPLSAAPAYATERSYDGFLAALDREGVTPGTIVIDDKWQRQYGTNEPDTEKWPDLAGWIARRRAGDQRVLLWYRAWATEGLPAEICVRNALGEPIGVDPTHPHGEVAIRRGVRSILAADALDADGLKIDFTARTPTGASTEHHGGAWGVELLRRLMDIVADEARSLKPDVLLIGHTPNRLIAPSVDMLRLNDALRLDDPHQPVDIVPQMRYRAAVVRAACPHHLIDTDDWCAPSLAAWRAYAEVKSTLGVPALYYATHIDLTGEPLEPADYELLRRTWAEYRHREGLPDRDSRPA